MSDHASLSATILTLHDYRREAVYGTEAYDLLVAHEKKLRVALAETPEHQAAQKVWRDRAMAARGRRVLGPKRRAPQGPHPVLSLALATVYGPTDDGPRCA